MLLSKSTDEKAKTSKMLRTVSLVLAVASFSWGMPLEPQLDNIRVVGGNDARQGQFPYQISIRRASTGGHNCGGSILNSKWILTAAHCVDGTSPSDWFIQSGSSLLSSGGTFHNLARMIIHEDYSLAWAIRNDIAVLELQDEIVFSDYARPIELETGHVGAVDATVSGWGLLWSGGSVPDNLQYLNLRTITNEQCQAVWGASLVGPDEICAVGEVGQGVCSADSGGPLVANGRQIGVVSWGGNPCGSGRPDGYGRVSSFVEWIEKAISMFWCWAFVELAGDTKLPPFSTEDDNLVAEIGNGIFQKGLPLEPQLDNTRIIGGNDAPPGQYPHQISLRYLGNDLHQCGGSIVDSKWVLTAANCVVGTSPLVWIVQSGSSILGYGGTFHNLSRIIVHEDYFRTSAIRSDIALLELQDEIVFSDYARPIELETEDVGVVDATVSGWGLLWSGGRVPDNLQYLNVRSIANDVCRWFWGASKVGPDQICAVGRPGRGVCRGDSGGPLVANGKQIGVVSWGAFPCGIGLPDGYSRVSSFAEWIQIAISS